MGQRRPVQPDRAIPPPRDGARAASHPPAAAGHAARLLADDRPHRDLFPTAIPGENAPRADVQPRVGREASMRITPHDIRQQQFSSKMFKGYDPQEVDAFLDDVAEDYEAVLKEAAARAAEGKIRADIMGLKRTRRQLVEEFMATLERYHRLIGGELPADDADAGAP